MAKTGPDVIDGIRGPEHFPDRKGEGKAGQARPTVPAPREAAPEPKAGVRRYESDIKSLRIAVKNPRILFVDGENVEVDAKHAQFREGFFETDDPVIIKKLDGHTGMNVDYWDVDKRRAEKEDAAERLWLETVRANPHLLERLKVELGAQGFDLGAKPPTP